ncbi:MAG TPA: hypothetical protein PLA44_13685 [Propionibacteriaceae bacterium]|nr:hypothetical protein [Propionibacteriaceae bacterium]
MSSTLVAVLLIALIAALIGVAASATGYGGFSLPAALVGFLSMPAQTAVLHGLVAQPAARHSDSGAAGHLAEPGHAPQPGVLVAVMAALAIGSVIGVRLHHRVRADRLVYPVALASMASAAWLFRSAIGS